MTEINALACLFAENKHRVGRRGDMPADTDKLHILPMVAYIVLILRQRLLGVQRMLLHIRFHGGVTQNAERYGEVHCQKTLTFMRTAMREPLRIYSTILKRKLFHSDKKNYLNLWRKEVFKQQTLRLTFSWEKFLIFHSYGNCLKYELAVCM